MKREKKAKKPPKPASLFRKPIPEARFRKSVLGLIEQKADKEFLESCFALREGKLSLKDGLDRESLVRLNRLAKVVKSNRGFVKTGPLVVVILFAAALVVFGLFFMNPLLEKAAEGGLQALFEAKAEVSGLRLNPIGLRLGIGGIAVANRDEPMTNLFETGRMELRLNLASALRGRLYIEEASVASISLGGPRKVSGALPGIAPAVKPAESPREAGAPIVDFQNFDAKALLEREKSKLASTAAYEKAGAAYAEAAQRWKDRAASAKKSVAELESESKKVLAIDINGLVKNKSLPEAIQAVTEAKAQVAAVVESSKTVASEAKDVAAGVKADSAAALALEKMARSSIDADFAYLKSFIDPKSGAAMGALDPVIRNLLSDKGERYYAYARRALELLARLKNGSGGGTAKEKKPKAEGLGAGRDVAFPSALLPRFRLGLLGAEFPAGGAAWKVELRELSSDPQLVAQPTAIDLASAKGRESIEAAALVDMRQEGRQLYSVDARADGLPLDLGAALAKVGVGSFTGTAGGTLELEGGEAEALSARGVVSIRDPAAAASSGQLGQAIADAINGTDLVRVDIGYERPASGSGKLSIRTNLDSIVASAMKALAARYADKALAEVKASLKDYVGAELEGKLGSKLDLDTLLSGSAVDLKSADSLKAALDGKITALESKAKELAAAKAAELGSSLLKSVPLPAGTAIPALPSVPSAPAVPSLPALPAIPKLKP